MRIGSLFSGAGGLDMAVENVFGASTAWHCELNDAASKVLAHRWPGVPNHRDITTTDWTTVEPVDILCGGFPCQDVSSAGKRAGLKDGTRSGLWSYYVEAIDALRPRFVVIENVRGLLSATAHRAMEPGEDALGDRNSEPVLRAVGAVLGDLSDVGYDAQWATVSAASVGAPHRRERVFILATDTEGQRRSMGDTKNFRKAHREVHTPRNNRVATPDAPGVIGSSGTDGDDAEALDCARVGAGHRNSSGDFATGISELGRGARGSSDWCDTCGHSSGDHWDSPTGCQADGPYLDGKACPCTAFRGGATDAERRSDVAVRSDGHVNLLLPTPTSRDHKGANQRSDETCLTGALLPTPRKSDGDGGCNPMSTPERMDDVETRIIRTLLPTPGAADGAGGGHYSSDGHQSTLPGEARLIEPQWGKYAPAIARWENVTRPAPPPTEPNRNGNPRLSAAFSEWLMGWPNGWVTDVPGISRNDALRIVGNGVCPQQATAALRYLLSVCEMAA